MTWGGDFSCNSYVDGAGGREAARRGSGLTGRYTRRQCTRRGSRTTLYIYDVQYFTLNHIIKMNNGTSYIQQLRSRRLLVGSTL